VYERAHHVTVSGSGNAVNVGGSSNSTTVNNNHGTQRAVDAAVQAIRALAADVDGPAKIALEFGAEDIESTADRPRMAASLKRVQEVITSVSSTVSTASAATSAVSAAMRALGL
jgi:ribonuclease D